MHYNAFFFFVCRCGEQGMMPSLNRSMSVPDTGSMWDMHTSASQPAGTHRRTLKESLFSPSHLHVKINELSPCSLSRR